MPWYTLQTANRSEAAVQRAVQRLIAHERIDDAIRQVVVPTREETDYHNGKTRTATRPLFPGYVFVDMDMDDHLNRLVRSVPGSRGFISEPDETTGLLRPIAMSDAEASRFLQTQAPVVIHNILPGDTVTIADGPFADITVLVTHTNIHTGELTALATFFGRETPLTIQASQVAKAA